MSRRRAENAVRVLAEVAHDAGWQQRGMHDEIEGLRLRLGLTEEQLAAAEGEVGKFGDDLRVAREALRDQSQRCALAEQHARAYQHERDDARAEVQTLRSPASFASAPSTTTGI